LSDVLDRVVSFVEGGFELAVRTLGSSGSMMKETIGKWDEWCRSNELQMRVSLSRF